MKKQLIHIGTSGWSYDHWKDNFYPEDLKATERLGYYAKHFDTVEINTTFYGTPRPLTIENWKNAVPNPFLFSIKASRYITHQKKLHDCETSLGIFYESIDKLKNNIGTILFQLPPSFKINQQRLIDFTNLLDTKYRYTFEFRHDSWFSEEIYRLLSTKNIALCITDLKGKLSPLEITADFLYIRLHGPKLAYKGSYGHAKLKDWKNKIEEWNKKFSVFCYFDNDEKGYAIQDATYLHEILKNGDEKEK